MEQERKICQKNKMNFTEKATSSMRISILCFITRKFRRIQAISAGSVYARTVPCISLNLWASCWMINTSNALEWITGSMFPTPDTLPGKNFWKQKAMPPSTSSPQRGKRPSGTAPWKTGHTLFSEVKAAVCRMNCMKNIKKTFTPYPCRVNSTAV